MGLHLGMGKTYSEDLRLKALAAIDGGQKKMVVHRLFGISRSTLDDWLLLRDRQGHVAPLPRKERAGRGFFDALVFEAFALGHKEATLRGMQEAWESEHEQRLSEKTFSNWLVKLGWTRKKRASSTLSDTKTNAGSSSKS